MRFAIALFTVLLCAVPSFGAVTDAEAEYSRAQQWLFSAPITLPAGGVTLTRDVATWTLTSGTIRLMAPAEDGTITGFVFEGDGRFTMAVPDRFELAQLRRFAAKPELAGIDQKITQLVFRASDDSINKAFAGMTAAAHTANPLAQKRHEQWLVKQLDDVDAAIVAARLNAGALHVTADMNTADFDWLTFDYDSGRIEEVRLTRVRSDYPEIWVSLDRAEERTKEGRPGGPLNFAASLDHIDVTADLLKMGRSGEIGIHNQRAIDGHYVADVTFTILQDGLRALNLAMSPQARELRISENGTSVVFLRDAIGRRALSLDNRVADDDMILVLPAPAKKGDKRTFRFEYDLETGNYAAGGTWYPHVPSAFDPHTAKLTLTVSKRNEVRAMGRRVSEKETDRGTTSEWVVERPTKMVTFSTATRFEEVKLDVQGIPPVIAFGPSYQLGNKNKVRNVGADVANSLQYFQHLLDDKLTNADQFYVTSIAAGHGQAFDGFLHMSEYTFTGEHPGASELFRAHEVAHEWFGHKVGWKTYRDQWLSEALAEYAAMMFVQGFVKGGDKYFNEILNSYEGIVLGHMGGGFSKFNRPWLIEFDPRARARVGPIGHGFRAGTTEMPYGYQIQTYHKGPLVVHMLRSLLLYRTNSDDTFIKILREYVKEYSGKSASTEDFRRVVERVFPNDWSFFFDTWVYGNEIPTYTWNWKSTPVDGGFALTVDLRRSGVSSDFTGLFPVRIDFEDGKSGIFFISNKEAQQSVTQKVAKKPKNVFLAPDHSMLGTIRKD